ncbi:hypothetical protein DFH28DRAFT_634886 [Melampsora americana]|nr:hypothetical protein DFH28DRAFT_634886 [Melampsora americana]
MTSNPFRNQLEMFKEFIAPQFPTWALAALVLFGIMRGIFVLGSLAIMLIPMFKGSQSRKHHYFLVRRVYSNGDPGRFPYLVPNRCMVIVICEMISSVAYLFSAYVNYQFYSTDIVLYLGRQQQWYPPHWYALPWIPSYLGIMLSSWGLCHSCLFDVDGKDKGKLARILTPMVYNSIWMSWTLITIGSMLYWSISLGIVFLDLQLKSNDLISLLRHAAKSWDSHHDLSRIDLRKMSNVGNSIFTGWNYMRPMIIGWSVTLIVLAGVLLCFYVFVVRLLLRMLKQVLRIRDMNFLNEASQDSMWAELEDEFRFLSRSYFVITVIILVQVLEVIFQIISGEHIDVSKFQHSTRLNFRIGSALITQVPGIFMGPALLLQSWRIFTERFTADESDFHNVSSKSDQRSLPQMSAQLLGWNSTVCWSRESELEVTNFPGLREIQMTDSGYKLASTESIHIEQSLPLSIDILRCTVVTHDVE